MTDPYVDAHARLKRSKAEAEESIREREEQPLKNARSKAELTRVRQGWVLICLNATSLSLTILLILKTFGVI